MGWGGKEEEREGGVGEKGKRWIGKEEGREGGGWEIKEKEG